METTTRRTMSTAALAQLATEEVALGDLRVDDCLVLETWQDSGQWRLSVVRELVELNEDTEVRLSDRTEVLGSSRRSTVLRLRWALAVEGELTETELRHLGSLRSR